MGLPILARELIAHGLAPTTPAAVIQQATTAQQRVVAGTLAELPRLAADAGLVPPTLIVVGDVVARRSAYAWFDPELAVGAVAAAVAGAD